MSLFYEVTNESFQPVVEGWGKVASILIPIVGPLIHLKISKDYINKLMANPKLNQYISSKCNEFFNKSKKQYSKISKQIPNDADKMFQSGLDIDKQTSVGAKLKYNCVGKWNINGYTIWVFGDTDHIQTIMLSLWDSGSDKPVTFNIPAPSNQELKFYKE